MELQETLGSRRPSCESLMDQQHLHPSTYTNVHRRSPSIRLFLFGDVLIYSFRCIFICRRGNSPSLTRSPSPGRHYPHHLHHDIGFSDTVSNVVEIVKHEHHRSHSNKNRYMRGELFKLNTDYPA